MAKTISLTVNGKSLFGRGRIAHLVDSFSARWFALDRLAYGLRGGALRRLHRVMERHAGEVCMVFAVQAEGDEIITVEGLAQDKRLHPLQEAFWNSDAVECGFCTPGMLMSAYGLLNKLAHPATSRSKKRFRAICAVARATAILSRRSKKPPGTLQNKGNATLFNVQVEPV